MANVFNRGKFKLLDAYLSGAPGSPDLRVLLLNGGYAYDPDDDFVSAVAAAELVVGGYARQALAGVAGSEDDAADRAEVEANEVTFGPLDAGDTIVAAVVFENTGNDATSELLAFYPLGSVPTNGGQVTLRFGGTSPGDFLRILDS